MSANTPFLMPNEQLSAGQMICSPDGRFVFGIHRSSLVMQLLKFVPNIHDRSLSEAAVISAPYIERNSNKAYLVMNADSGNLFLIDPGRGSVLDRNKPKWLSRHPRYPGAYPNAYLVLQPDGNLVIYRAGGGSSSADAIWDTDTVQPASELGACVTPNFPTINVVNGVIAAPGTLSFSNDWDVDIAMRDGQTYIRMAPGDQVTINRQPGTLAIEPVMYANDVFSSDANPDISEAFGSFSTCEVPSNASGVVLDSNGLHSG